MKHPEASTDQLQELIAQGAAGQASAYDQLLKQASDRFLRLTRKMLRAYPRLQRWEQTDDVFQTAAMRLHRSLAEVKPPTVAAFWGFAATQIRRTLIDLARHHFGPEGSAAHYHSDCGNNSSPEGASLHARSAGTDGGPVSLEDWAEFHEAVDRLPPDERDVFRLAWYAELPQKDIAESLNISLPTVQRRWYAAKLHLFELTQGKQPSNDLEPQA